MNVVIVSEMNPYPANTGARLRMLSLARRLASRHNIVFLWRASADPADDRLAAEHVRSCGMEPMIVGTPPAAKSGAGFYARLAMNLLSRRPYAVTSHRSPDVIAAMQRLGRQRRIDVWQCEWMAYADALPLENRAPLVTIAHDVTSNIWERYYEHETHPLRRWYIKRQWKKFLRYEPTILHKATRVVAVSDVDAQILRLRYGLPHVDVIENGVDNAHVQAVSALRRPQEILFVGTLDSGPNIDAVRLLLDRIFPAVQRQMPQARLTIVGRKPPESILNAVRANPAVELHADAADVRPFLASAALTAIPLRIGSGSRLKILEACAAGLPVITTSMGAEGLQLDERHLVFAKLDDMADAIVQTLTNPQSALARAQAARQVVQRRYDWEVLADKLEHCWHLAVGSVSPSLVLGS